MKQNFVLWLCLLLFFISNSINGQSLFDRDGNKLVNKIGENQYNVTGSIFTFKNGQFIETLNKDLEYDLNVYTSVEESGRINYFDLANQYIGYYVPAENRYYRIFQGKQVEDEHIALLFEGKVYTLDEQHRYEIEEGFPPEILGFILFFFFY